MSTAMMAITTRTSIKVNTRFKNHRRLRMAAVLLQRGNHGPVMDHFDHSTEIWPGRSGHLVTCGSSLVHGGIVWGASHQSAHGYQARGTAGGTNSGSV